MIRKTGVYIALAAALLFPATSSQAQTDRVAYVDIDRVTAQSDRINKAMDNVSGRVESIQKELEEKRRRLVDLKAEVRRGEGVLAESEMKKRRDESTKLEKEIVDLEYEGRRELEKLDSTVFEPMIKTIVLAIQDVAREKNIDLVLRGEAVIYGANVSDITQDVVKKLNSPSFNPDASASESDDDKGNGDDNSESTSSRSTESTSRSDSASPTSLSSDDSVPAIPLRRRPVDRQPE